MRVTAMQDAAQAQGERGASAGALIAGDRVHRSSTLRPWAEHMSMGRAHVARDMCSHVLTAA